MDFAGLLQQVLEKIQNASSPEEQREGIGMFMAILQQIPSQVQEAILSRITATHPRLAMLLRSELREGEEISGTVTPLDGLIARLNTASAEEAPALVQSLVERLASLSPNAQSGQQFGRILSTIRDKSIARKVRDEVEELSPNLIHFFFRSQQKPIWEPVPRSVEALVEALAKAGNEAERQKIRDATEWNGEGNGILERYLYQKRGYDLQVEISPYNVLSRSVMNVKRAIRQGNWGQARASIAQAITEAKRYLQQFPQTLVLRQMYSCVLNTSADIAKAQGKLEEAGQILAQSLEIREELVQRTEHSIVSMQNKASTLDRLGDIAKEQGKLEEAAQFFAQSLEIFEELAKRTEHSIVCLFDKVTILEKLGDITEAQGKLGDATQFFIQSLEICEELGERTEDSIQSLADKSVNLDKVGDIVKKQGGLGEAALCFAKSLEIREEVVKRTGLSIRSLHGKSASLERLGDIAKEQGKLEEAALRFAQSLEIHEELVKRTERAIESLRGKSVSLVKLGNIAKKQGKLGEAAQFFAQSLEICEEVVRRTDRSIRSLCDKAARLERLGDIAYTQGNRDHALSFYTKTLADYQEILERKGGWLRNLQDTLRNGWNCHNVLHAYPLALQFLAIAKQSWLELYENAPEHERFRLAGYAGEYGENLTTAVFLGYREKSFAPDRLNWLVAELESVRTRHIAELIHRREATPDFTELEQAASAGNPEAQQKLEKVKTAYQRFSELRQRLEEREVELRRRSSLHEELLKKIVVLDNGKESGDAERLAVAQEQYHENRKDIDALGQERDRERQEFYREALVIREAVPDFLPTAKEMSFADISALAQEGEALVTFSITHSGTLVLALTHGIRELVEGQSLFWIPEFTRERMNRLLIREENGNKAGWLYALVTGASPETELSLVCRALYDELFHTVDSALTARNIHRLVFIPSGGLVLCPLHLMQLNGNGTEPAGKFSTPKRNIATVEKPPELKPAEASDHPSYLLDKYQISYAPSFKLLEICRRRQERAWPKVSGVANPTGDLIFADVEAQAIREKLAPITKQLQFLERERATLTSTLSLLSNEGILHFACHGLFDFARPLHSCLLLHPDRPGQTAPPVTDSKLDREVAPRQVTMYPQPQRQSDFTKGTHDAVRLGSLETEEPAPLEDLAGEVCLERGAERIVLTRDSAGAPLIGHFEKHGKVYHFQPLTLERVLTESHLSHTALVILSACQVGLGDVARVAEAVSIPAAFLCGGVASVIAGLWPVDDLATCLIMEQFYHHLAQGYNKQEALQAACNYVRCCTKNELLAKLHEWQSQTHDPSLMSTLQDTIGNLDKDCLGEFPFQHPWYWGAFYLSGTEAIPGSRTYLKVRG